MKNRVKMHRTVITFVSAILLTFILTASFSCWGSPAFELIVENQTEYDLTIYVNDYKIGNVNAGEQITKTGIPWDTGKYHIEVKNTHGEIIFSKTLNRAQMQKIESRVYKAVIPPLED